MENLNDILLFLEVARQKSFSAAARTLNMQKSTLSRRLSLLEHSLGVSLLRRTTRQVVLTSEGEKYFNSCQLHVEALLQSKNLFEKNLQEISGDISITAPLVLGQNLLPRVIAEFIQAFPLTRVHLSLEDRMVDLIGEKYDVAIRAGPMRDSTLKGQRLGQNRFMIFVSPEFFKKNKKRPLHPRDLAEEKAIIFCRPSGDFPWILNKGDAQFKFQPQVAVRVNHLETAKALCVAGVGLALLPEFLCQEDLQSGRLMLLCSEWTGEKSPVTLVYPHEPYPRKVITLFIKFLIERLKPVLS